MTALPAIGTATQGGYIAAYISTTANGQPTHGLIVSDAALEGTQNYSNTGPTTPSQIDGPGNFAAALAAGATAASWVQANFNAVEVGGFSDWYIPAALELAAIYWRVKPTTEANITGATAYANPYAFPAYVAADWQSGNPPKTSVDVFLAGGDQAFSDSALNYWTSTKTGASTIEFVDFGTGRVNAGDGAFGRLVRPVRRVAVAELVTPVPETDEDIWAANFADASGAAPQTTALIREADAQTLADHNVLQFLDRPRWYRLSVSVPIGELDDFKVGMVRTFRADLPGLTEGKKLRIFGRQGTATPGNLILLCRG